MHLQIIRKSNKQKLAEANRTIAEQIDKMVLLQNEIGHLEEEVDTLRDDLSDLEDTTKEHPEQLVVKKILDRKIQWYDYESLPTADKVRYCAQAEDLKNNEVFKNEIQHMFADLVNASAKSSKDFDEVIRIRMKMTGIEVLQERVKTIHHTKKTESKKDLNSVI